jgi:hypothetical protein
VVFQFCVVYEFSGRVGQKKKKKKKKKLLSEGV